ncbi:MAG TPA: MFS transporter [Alphaproteobacteria bacterium]|nr:MFS transporter [Alphaproteobacteria bacterium]
MNQGTVALIITLAIQALTSWAALTGPVLAPLAASDLGLAPHLIGYYVSLTYALAATSGLVSGGFIARFGPLRVSQASVVLCGAGLAVATLGSGPAVLASAVLIGAGYGPITPSSSHILARTTAPERLNLVFSLKQTGVPLGGAIAGIVLPGLARALGWRGAVLVTAILCVAVALVAEPLRRDLDTGRDSKRTLLSFGQIAAPLGDVFRSRELRMLALTAFAFAGMQQSLLTFLVTYLSGRIGMSIDRSGFVFSAALIASVTGRIVWGMLADRFIAPFRLLGVLGLTMSGCAVLVGFFTPAWPFIAIVAVCIAYGATAIAWNGVQLAQVARHAPPGRAAEITGGCSFVMFAGVVAVPYCFAFVLGTIGSYTVGYCAVAVLTWVSGLSYLRHMRRGTRT